MSADNWHTQAQRDLKEKQAKELIRTLRHKYKATPAKVLYGILLEAHFWLTESLISREYEGADLEIRDRLKKSMSQMTFAAKMLLSGKSSRELKKDKAKMTAEIARVRELMRAGKIKDIES